MRVRVRVRVRRELCETTGLDVATMKNVLGSMVFAKDLGVLKKTPKTKAIEDDHTLELDAAYRNPNVRITLPIVAVEEKKHAAETVSQERMIVIDAALVRIMKTRKTLSHAVRCLFFSRPLARPAPVP
jgi:cullin 4